MTIDRAFQTWQQFKRDFSKDLNLPGPMILNYVFRGQADSQWSIESSFDRICPGNIVDRDDYYKKMLAFFSYQLRQYGEDLDNLPRQDRGAIAQHYGMPTRLIDWSRSPYVAAFMAFFTALTEKRISSASRIAIWALDIKRFSQICVPGNTMFRTVKTRLLQNDRVWRQAGLFVEAIGETSKLDTYLEDQLGPEDSSAIIKYTIPSTQALEALNDLILMGLTPATIYPDRDGAAKYVRLRMALEELEGNQ